MRAGQGITPPRKGVIYAVMPAQGGIQEPRWEREFVQESVSAKEWA